MKFNSKVKELYKITATVAPAVYVGTYGKYNEGSIKGKWLKLEDYASYDDFIEAAKELHKDEADPELMFQDYEGFPKRYYGESSLDKDLWDWLALDEDDREMLEIYIDEVNDDKATIEQAKDAFIGKYNSESDWASEFIDDMGGLSKDQLSTYLTISETDARLIAQDLVGARVEDLRYELEKRENYSEVFDVTRLNKTEYEILKEEQFETPFQNKLTLDNIMAKIYKLAEESIDEWEDQQIEEIQNSIIKDPVGYFVDEEEMYSIEDLAKTNFMQIDYDAYARDARLSGDMNFVHKDGEVWVFSAS